MILSQLLEKLEFASFRRRPESIWRASNVDPGLRRNDEQEADTADPLRSLIDARRGALPQQFRFARVAGQRCRAFELRARLVAATQLEQQVAAHAGQQMVIAQRARFLQRVDALQRSFRAFGHRHGDGAISASRAYNDAIRVQSVSRACSARTWQAAMAACSA